MKKDNSKIITWIIIIFIGFMLLKSCGKENEQQEPKKTKDTFTIISSTSTSALDDEIKKFGKENKINIEIEHYGDLEIVDILNNNSTDYDAVWISNSIWLYMLENQNLIKDSKSIVIDPVVMAVEKSKAKELGFVNKEVKNKDILETIKQGKLKYVMSSVTQTNTGATAYFNFLNSLAGNPEVLTSEILKQEQLQKDLKEFFKGVERVSGNEDYLIEMYEKGNYNAMINYESSLIELNKKLVNENKEPLYLIYPTDGVAINDMPFAYINNDSQNKIKQEQFDKIQNYLRSDKITKLLEQKGYRSWFGGIKKDTDSNTFNKEWGIDTTVYLKDMKYPSKTVMTEALNLYIEMLRKPTHVVFCLDISGSMSGDGLQELQEAMNYILDYEKASNDKIQFSDTDKITVITFNGEVDTIYDTKSGNNTKDVIKIIDSLEPNGTTNIYDPSIEALRILEKEKDDYTKTVILMTDGASNSGTFKNLKKYYNDTNKNIPIYSITFGSSREDQLKEIADLTNGKVFDGKKGLTRAFKEVRSYN